MSWRDGVVFAGLMPNSPILADGVARYRDRMLTLATRNAMSSLARRSLAVLPDLLVVLSPRSPRQPGSFGLWQNPVLRGSFQSYAAGTPTFALPLDQEFVHRLVEEAKSRGLHTWPLRDDELDFGAAVPLWYATSAGWEGPTVVIGLSGVSTAELDLLGHAIAAAAESLQRRVAVIASGDMSHHATAASAGGFREAGARFDRTFVEWLRAGRIAELAGLDGRLREHAVEDVVDATIVAYAAASREGFRHEFLSYEAPFGIGFGVAILAEDPNPRPREDGETPRVISHPADLPRVAREAVMTRLAGQGSMEPFEAAGPMLEPRGLFVTLRTATGALRGCRGTPFGWRHDLVETTWHFARAASFKDPKYPALRPEELERVRFSVTVLGRFEVIQSLSSLDPAVYGIAIRAYDGRQGLMLPAIKGVVFPDQQVRAAKRKADIGLDEPISIQRFAAYTYSEPPPLAQGSRSGGPPTGKSPKRNPDADI